MYSRLECRKVTWVATLTFVGVLGLVLPYYGTDPGPERPHSVDMAPLATVGTLYFYRVEDVNHFLTKGRWPPHMVKPRTDGKP
jgi:hypothetical protein